MAASHFSTTNYASTHLVESAGGIVFSRQRQQHDGPRRPGQGRRRMCILWHVRRQEFLLAKGRRDHGESRAAAALREVREETGVAGLELLPVRLRSRATPPPLPPPPPDPQSSTTAAAEGGPDIAASDPNIPDEVRVFENSTEPFLCTVRDLSDGSGQGKEVKLIWWFVMQASDEEIEAPGNGAVATAAPAEEGFERRWMDVDEALAALTFKADREIARTAVELVRETYPPDYEIAGL